MPGGDLDMQIRLAAFEFLAEQVRIHGGVLPAKVLGKGFEFRGQRVLLARIWRRAAEAAGLPHISLYEGTKHSFATDAIRRGVPERHLQRFLGHASIQPTHRYARLADNALAQQLNAVA